MLLLYSIIQIIIKHFKVWFSYQYLKYIIIPLLFHLYLLHVGKIHLMKHFFFKIHLRLY